MVGVDRVVVVIEAFGEGVGLIVGVGDGDIDKSGGGACGGFAGDALCGNELDIGGSNAAEGDFDACKKAVAVDGDLAATRERACAWLEQIDHGCGVGVGADGVVLATRESAIGGSTGLSVASACGCVADLRIGAVFVLEAVLASAFGGVAFFAVLTIAVLFASCGLADLLIFTAFVGAIVGVAGATSVGLADFACLASAIARTAGGLADRFGFALGFFAIVGGAIAASTIGADLIA